MLWDYLNSSFKKKKLSCPQMNILKSDHLGSYITSGIKSLIKIILILKVTKDYGHLKKNGTS